VLSTSSNSPKIYLIFPNDLLIITFPNECNFVSTLRPKKTQTKNPSELSFNKLPKKTKQIDPKISSSPLKKGPKFTPLLISPMSEQQVIQRFDTSFANVTNNLKNEMSTLQAARSATEALPHIQAADAYVRQAEGLFKGLEQEKRHMDNASRTAVDRKKKIVLREWETLKQNYNTLKSKYNTSQLSASQQAELRDQRQKLLVARDIQQDTTQSLTNTENTLQQTILVGRDTNQKLDQQTEQLGRMNNSVEATNDALDNSKTVLMRMKRRILTNKLAHVAIIVLEIIILACIIYIRFYSHDSK